MGFLFCGTHCIQNPQYSILIFANHCSDHSYDFTAFRINCSPFVVNVDLQGAVVVERLRPLTSIYRRSPVRTPAR